MARRSNPETLSGVVAWTYGFAVQYGVLRADDSVVRAGEDAVRTAQKASSDRAMGLATYTLAVGLLNRDGAADNQRGLECMMRARDIWLRKRALFLIPVTDVWAARETARRGDRDTAIREMRQAVDELRQAGNLFYGLWATGLLVETLLERGTQGDLAEAQEEFDRLANLRADQDSSMLEITLLRLRALLAQARGDDVIACARRCRAIDGSDVEDVALDDDPVGLFALNKRNADRRGCHGHTKYDLHRYSNTFAGHIRLSAGSASHASRQRPSTRPADHFRPVAATWARACPARKTLLAKSSG